jgi:hypothetical protein
MMKRNIKEDAMLCEGCQAPVWKAGEVAPAGVYVRIDDDSYRQLTLKQDGPLPASFDGHVALYRAAAKVSISPGQVNRQQMITSTI